MIPTISRSIPQKFRLSGTMPHKGFMLFWDITTYAASQSQI